MAVSEVAIVFNPKGGSASQSTVETLVRILERRGKSVEKLTTTPEPGSAKMLARSASAKGARTVVALGGDGTICQVAEGLIGTGTEMAAFPGGTGNLFIRSFYARPTPELFANMVLNGHSQPVDMIRLNYVDTDGKEHDQLFMTALGLGPLSDSILVGQNVKRTFGKLAYVAGVSRAAVALKPVNFSLTFDNEGSKRERQVQAAVLVAANVLPPNFAHFSRGCNASDGLLDAAFIEGRHVFDLIPSIGHLALGHPERSRFYQRFRTKSLKVSADQPVIPNIDGDASAPTHELTLTVVPQAINMVLS